MLIGGIDEKSDISADTRSYDPDMWSDDVIKLPHYLHKSLPKLCSHKAVDQEIRHGIENQENVRHKTENDDPDGKPSEICFFTTENMI